MVALEQNLSDLEQERLRLEGVKTQLESDKVSLEQQKFNSERRWKVYSAIGAVGSALLTAATTQLVPALRSGDVLGARSTHTGGIVRFFDKSNDFLASGDSFHFEPLLSATKSEIWCLGSSFYISTDTYREKLVEKLRSGVNLNFLILNPDPSTLSRAAVTLNAPERELRDQVSAGLRSLLKLREEAKKLDPTAGKLSVRLTSELIASRLYFFDPKSMDGRTYVVPQVNRVNSQQLPGIVVQNKDAKYIETYFSGMQRVWSSDTAISLEQWLQAHPDVSDELGGATKK